MKKYRLSVFQNSLDYETFVKLLEIHKKQLSWKMYFEKMKKTLCNYCWLEKLNVMSKNKSL